MIPSGISPHLNQEPVLTGDQQNACERLLAIARVRSGTTEAALPVNVLGRWSVPLLVGPAGSGKEFVCQEVARRLGSKPCRRWEIASWIIVSNRSSGTTLEQIEKFIDDHPQGCVIYLAGIDTLGTTSERNLGYHQARLAEVEQFLDWTASRPVHFIRRDGGMLLPNVLVIVGGRFAALWGDNELGGPSGVDSWKNADQEPLADARAVSSWLAERSEVPGGILRRVAPEPLILRPLDGEEAGRLAEIVCRSLPPALDGIGSNELTEALRGPGGWRAVANVIEQALESGYEGLPIADGPVAASAPVSPPLQAAAPAQSVPRRKPTKKSKPLRLADHLSLGSHRSTLLPQARRLGLTSIAHLEALAVARGYMLPDSDDAGPQIFSADAWKAEMRDVELAVALLSPGLEFCERAICRGALMLLRISRVTESFWIVREAGRERSWQVIRHVATLGLQAHPQEAHWRKLLAVLPRESTYCPALLEGTMPDAAILKVLANA